MTEREYWNHFEQLASDIDEALEVFHAEEEIHRLAREDDKIRRCLDADALFWNMQVESLQSALFIILGRLFDSTKDTLSVSKFLDETIEYLGYFSKEALATRKVAGGPKPDWLDDRIDEAWVPDRAALAKLKEALQPHEERAGVYRQIRHKHYAHRSLKDGHLIRGLFQQTNKEELSQTLGFLCDLKAAIWQLYNNGKKPNFDESSHQYDAEAIRESVRSVLNKLTQASAVHLTIDLDREEEGRWIAETLELPGVMCYGQSRDEAISNAERLAIEVIADRIAHGELPSSALAVSFSIPDEQLARQ